MVPTGYLAQTIGAGQHYYYPTRLLTTMGMCGSRRAPMVPHALHWYTYHCKVLFTIDNHSGIVLFARARIIECRWYIFPSIRCRIKYRYLNVNITIDIIQYVSIITGHTQKHKGIKQYVIYHTQRHNVYKATH
jgi:hypothetical protein